MTSEQLEQDRDAKRAELDALTALYASLPAQIAAAQEVYRLLCAMLDAQRRRESRPVHAARPSFLGDAPVLPGREESAR